MKAFGPGCFVAGGVDAFPFNVQDQFIVDDLTGILSDGNQIGEPGVSDLPNHGANTRKLQWIDGTHGPVFQESFVGTYPAAEHASGDRLITDDSSNFDTQQDGFTVAYVGLKNTTADGAIYYNAVSQYMWVLDASVSISLQSGFAKSFPVATPDNTPFALIVTVEDNGDGTAEVFVNLDGADIAPGDADHTQNFLKASSGFNTLGRTSTTDAAIWTEFMFWNKTLTPAQVADVMSYFQSKYPALP